MCWIQDVGIAAAFGCVVFVACLVGIESRLPGTLAVFWPANALLLGLLLRIPRAATAWTWLAAAVGYLAADLLTGADLPKAVLLNAANLSGAMAAFCLCRRFRPDGVRLDGALQMVWLTAMAIVAAAVGGITGSIAQVALFGAQWWPAWLGWFAEELINYTVIVPIVLAFPVRGEIRRPTTPCLIPLGLLLASMAAAWSMEGFGTLAFTMPAVISAALLCDAFVTSVLTMVATVWSLVLAVHQQLDLSPGASEIPVGASTLIGVALLATAPLTIACATAESERVNRALLAAVTLDDLTGAYRRGEFVRRSEAAVADARRRGLSTVLLMMDLDHFKRLNDNFGHQAGDRALREFAQIVMACAGPNPLFARLGGEEFALLLTGIDDQAAYETAQTIRSHQERRATEDFGSMGSTVSVGIAHSARSAATLNELLATADEALYAAKSTLRNTVVVGDVRPAAADR